jgi:hypothetical protein
MKDVCEDVSKSKFSKIFFWSQKVTGRKRSVSSTVETVTVSNKQPTDKVTDKMCTLKSIVLE